jgi:hypothetical protein
MERYPVRLLLVLIAVFMIGLVAGCMGGEPDASSEDQQKAASQPDANTAPGQAAETQEKAF